MGLQQFVLKLASSADFLLFVAYGAMAVRAVSSRSAHKQVRFIWLCLLALVIVTGYMSWGGLLFRGLPFSPWTGLLRVGSNLLIQGLALAAALRLSGCPWRLVCAPVAASVLATSYAAALSVSGMLSVNWAVSLWHSVTMIWHVVCAGMLWLAVRSMRRAKAHSKTCICCSACAYPLTGLISPDRCPECGATFAKAT